MVLKAVFQHNQMCQIVLLTASYAVVISKFHFLGMIEYNPLGALPSVNYLHMSTVQEMEILLSLLFFLDIEMQCNWTELFKQLFFIVVAGGTLSHAPHIHHYLSNHGNQIWCHGRSGGSSLWTYGIWEMERNLLSLFLYWLGSGPCHTEPSLQVAPTGELWGFFPGFPWKVTPLITEQTIKVTVGLYIGCCIIYHPYMDASESEQEHY